MRPRVRQIIDTFVDKMHANSDPWERRFAEKFGIVLAAALLLSHFGLTPWTKQRARNAVARVYGVCARPRLRSTRPRTDYFVGCGGCRAEATDSERSRRGNPSLPINRTSLGGTLRSSTTTGHPHPLPADGTPYNPSAITAPVLRKLPFGKSCSSLKTASSPGR